MLNQYCSTDGAYKGEKISRITIDVKLVISVIKGGLRRDLQATLM